MALVACGGGTTETTEQPAATEVAEEPAAEPTEAVSYTHLRAHETVLDLVCRLLLEKKKRKPYIMSPEYNMLDITITYHRATIK
mgnify:CR=1 FL=1